MGDTPDRHVGEPGHGEADGRRRQRSTERDRNHLPQLMKQPPDLRARIHPNRLQQREADDDANEPSCEADQALTARCPQHRGLLLSAHSVVTVPGFQYRTTMLAIEVITLVVIIFVALRSRPPEHRPPPRVLSFLAGLSLASFGVAMTAVVIFMSQAVFSVAVLVAGIAAATFLWLSRGDGDADDDDDHDAPAEPPGAGSDNTQHRFLRKRTSPTRPRAPSGPPQR